MVFQNRHVVLLMVAGFLAGGAIAFAAAVLMLRADLARVATERDALAAQADRWADAALSTATDKGKVEGQFDQAWQQARQTEAQLLATIAGLENLVAQNNQQLAVYQAALADQQLATPQSATAATIANLQNMVDQNNKQLVAYQTALANQQLAAQQYSDALNAANWRIASLDYTLEARSQIAPVVVGQTVWPQYPTALPQVQPSYWFVPYSVTAPRSSFYHRLQVDRRSELDRRRR